MSAKAVGAVHRLPAEPEVEAEGRSDEAAGEKGDVDRHRQGEKPGPAVVSTRWSASVFG
jgi:hypothetical protein